MTKCDHDSGFSRDVGGRRVCENCNEVVDVSGELVNEMSDLSAEFRVMPKIASMVSGVSYMSGVTINSVTEECEKVCGQVFSPEQKQEIVNMVERYRSDIPRGSLHSYEDAIRAATVIVLRMSGASIAAGRIIRKFNQRKSSVFRLVCRMSVSCPDMTPSESTNSLIRDSVNAIHASLFSNDTESLISSPKSHDSVQHIFGLTVELLDILRMAKVFPDPMKSPQAIACAYFATVNQPDFERPRREHTLIHCIRAIKAEDSLKCIYRDFSKLRKFADSSLLAIGDRSKSGSSFLKRLPEIRATLTHEKEIATRLNSMLVHHDVPSENFTIHPIANSYSIDS